jgi:hypothetical protein
MPPCLLMTPGHLFNKDYFLQGLNIYGCRALIPLLDIKAYPLRFKKCFESRSLDGTEMNENISPFIIFNKTPSLLLVKPLNFTLCHNTPSFPFAENKKTTTD